MPGPGGIQAVRLMDQPGLSLEKRAIREAWEERGYHLALFDLISNRVATSKSGVGLTAPARIRSLQR